MTYIIQILGVLSAALLILLLIGAMLFALCVIFIMLVHIFTGFIHKDFVPKVCTSVLKRLINPTDFQLDAIPKLVEDEIEKYTLKRRNK